MLWNEATNFTMLANMPAGDITMQAANQGDLHGLGRENG
jgi:hypothetical protein